MFGGLGLFRQIHEDEMIVVRSINGVRKCFVKWGGIRLLPL